MLICYGSRKEFRERTCQALGCRLRYENPNEPPYVASLPPPLFSGNNTSRLDALWYQLLRQFHSRVLHGQRRLAAQMVADQKQSGACRTSRFLSSNQTVCVHAVMN